MAAPLVWMDLEMTGLDPARDRIIEIAALITNSDLEIIAEGPNLIVHQPDEILDAMDEWNTKHHGASGLTERVRASTLDEESAAEAVLQFLQQHCEPSAAPLAGNSVHQDRRFLRKYMPAVDDYLHYRIIDVSTLKELGSRWYPEAYAKRPQKNATHRALDDIRESIAELRFYRKAFFRE
ncbi:MAG: oligoribonuclease [Myxococcota bacterium]